jgi:hypothetical protein
MNNALRFALYNKIVYDNLTMTYINEYNLVMYLCVIKLKFIKKYKNYLINEYFSDIVKFVFSLAFSTCDTTTSGGFNRGSSGGKLTVNNCPFC